VETEENQRDKKVGRRTNTKGFLERFPDRNMSKPPQGEKREHGLRMDK
jgi:hypothetical protein